MSVSGYSDPALWEAAKAAARERMGGHSARAMQLAGLLYRKAGGRYVGRKTAAQRSLSKWTDQDWTTKSGKPSRETGERYLPKRVIEKLTPSEYAQTTRAKRKGMADGKQYVKQPERIAKKVSKLKAKENPMKKPTPAQLAARERFAEMARSGAFKRKAKRNPAKKTVSQKRNPAPAPARKNSRVKGNPVVYRDIAQDVAPARVQYAVHMPDRPSYQAMAYFTKKADALEAAQEVSDRIGKPIAVSRVQVHFGPM